MNEPDGTFALRDAERIGMHCPRCGAKLTQLPDHLHPRVGSMLDYDDHTAAGVWAVFLCNNQENQ